MKLLSTFLSLFVVVFSLNAANPAFQDFYGTNGIIIQTNGNKVQVRAATTVVTNIVGGGSVLVTSNNLGTYTVFGMSTNGVTNIVILTNGVALGNPSALNFSSGITGYLSGITANLGVNLPGGLTTGMVANANIWTNDNARIRPIVYPTFRLYPTNDDANSPIMIMGGAGASNWMASGYGGVLRDYSILSANIVAEGDLNNRNIGVATAQDSGGARYGYAAFETRTNQSMVFTETLITGGGVNRFVAGHVDGTGNIISLQTNSVQAFTVDGAGGISLMKAVPQNWPDTQGGVATVLTNDGSGNLGWGTASGGIGFSDLVWTQEVAFARLVRGTTNSVKVMTNGLFGIALGDTNALTAYGWPYDGLTFADILDGTPNHNYNEMIIGVEDIGVAAGWLSTSAGAGSGTDPNVSTDGTIRTNGTVAFRSAMRIDKVGGLFAIHDDEQTVGGTYDNQVVLKSGDYVNTFFGNPTMIRARWRAQDRFLISTNGNMTLKGVVYSPPSAQGAAATVLTNDGAGNLGWGSTSGGATINPTDNYLPFRLNATTFSNSPLVRLQTNRLGFGITDSVLFYDAPARNLGAGRMVMQTVGSSVDNAILGAESGTNLSSATGNALVGSAVAPNLSSGDDNVGVGYSSLNALTTGSENVAVGSSALLSLISGTDNTAVGRRALEGAEGVANTALGRAAGASLIGAGIRNTFLGADSDTSITSTNSTAIGFDSDVTLNNQMVFGNGVSNYQFRGVNYVYPSAQGAASSLLTNDGSGRLGWSTDLNISQLAQIRTNQYTTNISFTPVIGSFWFQGTNGIPVTNNARVSLEWIPVMRSLRIGELGANINGPDIFDSTTAPSNYWHETNIGFGSIAFGSNNMVKGRYSTVLNGIYNIIHSNVCSTVVGGSNNIIYTNVVFSVIGGGAVNTIQMGSIYDVIGGGNENDIINSDYATIGGGFGGKIRSGSDNGTIGGGSGNILGTTAALRSTIGGGSVNQINGATDATIAGGANNSITIGATGGAIGGGVQNKVFLISTHSTVAGGTGNEIGTSAGAGAINSSIGGGNANKILNAADNGTIAGGVANQVATSRLFGQILGGTSNLVNTPNMGTAIGNFITNLTDSSVEIGHGAAGGNNRKARVDVNGLKVLTYSGAAAVGGTILVTNTPIFSAGAAETNLQAVTIGAHVLTNNQERLLVRASGRFAATSDAKEVKLVFGSETIFASGSQVANTGAWTLDAEIIRTGNTSQSVNASFHGGTNTAFITESSLDLVQTNGVATVLKITGTVAGDGGITNRSLTVTWMPNP